MRSKKGEKFLKKQNPKCEGKKKFSFQSAPPERDISKTSSFTPIIFSLLSSASERENALRAFF